MKKSAFKLLFALLACFVFTTAVCAATYIGDADGDGEYTEEDVKAVFKLLVAKKCDEKDIWRLDVTGDGMLTLGDAMELLDRMRNREKPSFCKIDNVEHSDCVWSYIKTGGYSEAAYTPPRYSMEIRFRIFVPRYYSPDKEYALAVHLHGLGAEKYSTSQLSGGTYFDNILKSKYAQDTILLLPQCPAGMTWPDDRLTIEATYKLIENLSKHVNIDKNRIYLSGHSNGSKGVAYMIMNHPNTFAAAVMGSGASEMKYYTEIENIATTPIWLFCGSADPISGFLTNVRTLYKTLIEMDADVKYTEFPGLEHNIFNTVGNTEGLVDWVFSKTLEN